VLLADRALYWPRARTLFVADVHLGKAAAFRAGGVPVPRGATANDLARLTALLDRTGATRLVVLGDFLHAAAGRVPALDVAFRAWRDRHPGLDVLLIRGNHDAHAGDPAPHWGIAVVTEPHLAAPFLLCPAPQQPPTGYARCGHVHPAVRVGDGHDSVRLPCFVLGGAPSSRPSVGSRAWRQSRRHPTNGWWLSPAARCSLFRGRAPIRSPALSGAQPGATGALAPTTRVSLLNAGLRIGAPPWQRSTSASFPMLRCRMISLSQNCNATLTVRRPARLWTNRCIAGGKTLDRSNDARQSAVFVPLLGTPSCGTKKPCHSARPSLSFVFISHLNTRCSRF